MKNCNPGFNGGDYKLITSPSYGFTLKKTYYHSYTLSSSSDTVIAAILDMKLLIKCMYLWNFSLLLVTNVVTYRNGYF